MALEKATLRSRMIAKRSLMPVSKARALSAKICSRILDIPAIRHSKSVGIYISFKNEVIAELLLSSLSKMRKKVFVPVVLKNDTVKFAQLKSLANTRKGGAGMREPVPKVFAKDSIDAFVVPGVAFDLNGFRVGWGRGHYDKFFSKNKAVKVGAAYDFQVVKTIDPKPHDIKMDWIITEKRILKL